MEVCWLVDRFFLYPNAPARLGEATGGEERARGSWSILLVTENLDGSIEHLGTDGYIFESIRGYLYTRVPGNR